LLDVRCSRFKVQRSMFKVRGSLRPPSSVLRFPLPDFRL
jgi:hypothetical protein